MLVVDDTVIYRKIVSDLLAEMSEVEVVGVAHNGRIAISKIKALKPDLITLDIEMPEVNGLEVLEYLREFTPGTGAVMLSTLTSKGGEMTMQALELGAFDFIPKPQSGTMAENKKAVKDALQPILKAFVNRKGIKNILSGVMKKGRVHGGGSDRIVRHACKRAGTRREKSEIIGIGISTGGPNALAAMMPGIPSNIDVPILIVQHMPPIFTQSLAKSLNSRCAIEVREAVNGEFLTPGTALIAPGGKQMKIVAGADGRRRVIKITDDPPENSCKPSVDYLFRSIAHHYVGRATGVIMTGMGSDGTTGLKLMKRNGAVIIAQDEPSCIVYGMPKAPVEAGIADIVAPLEKIAAEITRTVKNSC